MVRVALEVAISCAKLGRLAADTVVSFLSQLERHSQRTRPPVLLPGALQKRFGIFGGRMLPSCRLQPVPESFNYLHR